jgi:hypothetical protein
MAMEEGQLKEDMQTALKEQMELRIPEEIPE